MTAFISYSHNDKKFVDNLAIELIKNNTHIWLDRWELKVGDSMISKIQKGLTESDALLIVLSKSSIESEWCKKELAAGLMRELEEKKVIVLPVLIEDCEIPLFLKEKVYADCRTSLNQGLPDILNSLGKVINLNQGRIKNDDSTIDWSINWGFNEGLFALRFTLIEINSKEVFTLLTTVSIFCDESLTKRYKLYEKEGLGWLGRLVITDFLYDVNKTKEEDIKVLLEDQFPQVLQFKFFDPQRSMACDILIESMCLGEDNGNSKLLNISNYLNYIRDYMKQKSREPTTEEREKLYKLILGNPL